MKLYSYFRSSSSYRVRIAMNLKGLDYEIVPVHLLKDGGEQFADSFARLNPSHKIPVLADGEDVIFQSIAIIEYLDEKYPTKNLYPTTPVDRANVRTLCEIINSDIQPLQNLNVLKTLVKQYGFTDEQKTDWIRHWIATGFRSFEKTLQKTFQGSFCFGDSPTAADCFLIPQVYNALRYDVDMSEFPTIAKINDLCSGIEAFKSAHPDNQPDTPK